MNEINDMALDPRPVDHKHALPGGVSRRSSQSAELSVIAGLSTEGEK